jgi:peptidoglycan/LPS O-acetylase OafA/YrhL
VRAAQPRIEEFDVLRGGAILLVMFLHAYFRPWAVTPRSELLTLRITHLMAHSAVPAFLFMSGFLMARDRAVGFAVFLRRRLHRLALPTAFWMVSALLFEAWRRGGMSPDLLRAFALFNISGQFYYLVVLLMLTLACYPVRHWTERQLRWLTVAALVANLAAILYYQTRAIEGTFALLAYRNPLVWVFAFTFGLYLGRTRGHVAFGRRATIAAVAGMAAMAAIYLVRGETAGWYPTSYFGVTVFLFGALGFVAYPAGVRALARTRGGRIALSPLRALSPYAFAIYLTHKPFFVGWLSDRLVSNGPLSHDYLTLMFALFVTGSAASIAFVIAVDRLAPRLAALLLGVEHPHRPPSAGERQRAA